MKAIFRAAYEGERVAVVVDASAATVGLSAVQSFKDECDINRIMAKYQKSGALEWLAKRDGQYGDVTGMDFLEAMNTVVKGREMFDELPSSIRDKFRNDPAEFLDFVHNEDNQEELIKLGLARRKPEPEPAPAPADGAPS